MSSRQLQLINFKMALGTITLLACAAVASSEPGSIFGDLGNIGNIGNINLPDLGIVDPQVLLSQLLQIRGTPMERIQIQMEQMKQVDEKLQAQIKFTGVSYGNIYECRAQIFAYVVAQQAQILPQSVLQCSPVANNPQFGPSLEG